MLKFLTCGTILFFGALYFTRLYLKFERIIFGVDTLPLLDTNEAVDGVPFSCQGIVKTDNGKLLTSLYSQTKCVYYHSIKEKYVKSGKSGRWVVTENMAGFIPFYIEDDRGRIKVDLANVDTDLSGFSIDQRDFSVPDFENSEVDGKQILKHSPIETASTFLGLNLTSYGNERISEYILTPDTRVFAHGLITKRNGEPVLHEASRHPLIISRKTKQEYVDEFYKGKNMVFFVHLLMAIGFTIMVLSVNYFLKLDSPVVFLIIYTGNAVLLGSILLTVYNRIISLRQRAENALSNIDIELKRRYELIPKIITLVQEYTKYEKDIQTMVANLRVGLSFGSENQTAKTSTLGPLLALVEQYPQLKAASNYRSLMLNLVDTEERIASARGFYNRSVRKYNTLTRQFPFSIIAFFFSMYPMQFLTLTSEGNV